MFTYWDLPHSFGVALLFGVQVLEGFCLRKSDLILLSSHLVRITVFTAVCCGNGGKLVLYV